MPWMSRSCPRDAGTLYTERALRFHEKLSITDILDDLKDAEAVDDGTHSDDVGQPGQIQQPGPSRPDRAFNAQEQLTNHLQTHEYQADQRCPRFDECQAELLIFRTLGV
jgi:hypothetical protein